MTVYKNRGQYADIHDFNVDVGTGDYAVDDAAFSWLRSKHAGKSWSLRPDTTYTISQSIDMSGIEGQQIAGVNSRTTRIIQTNEAEPIIRWGGPRQNIQGLSIGYPSIPTATTAVGIENAQSASQSQIRDVAIFNVAKGIASAAGVPFGSASFFSNSVSHVRVTGWSDIAVELLSGGTGNYWSDIYLNNVSGGSFPNLTNHPCRMAMHLRNMDEQVFSQINLEGVSPSSGNHAVFFQQVGSAVINGLHVEACRPSADRSMVHLFSDRTQLLINGGVIDYNHVESGSSTALFDVGDNTRLTVQNLMVRENDVQSPWYFIRSSSGAVGAEVHAMGVDDEGVASSYPASPANFTDITPAGFGQVQNSTLRKYNDEWFSLVEGSQVYRVFILGGALSAAIS